MERLLILDSNSLLNRAFYAIPPLTNSEGIHTNAVYGFTNMLFKMKEEIKPDYIVAAFDRKAPTFRHKEYEDYKAGRKKMPPELGEQFPLVKEVLNLLAVNIYEIDGFEADDIIGTLAQFAEKNGIEVFIVTGDRDALQLASDNIKVVITKKGVTETAVYNKEAFIEEFGVTPTQYIDVKGLMGDKSDNIPGVPGVGEKTAFKLISTYGSMEGVLSHIDEISGKKLKENLETYSEQAIFSKKLATIMTEVPIEFDLEDIKSQENYNKEELKKLFFKLGMKSLLAKLPGDDLEGEEEVAKIEINEVTTIEGFKEVLSVKEGIAFISYSTCNANLYSKIELDKLYINYGDKVSLIDFKLINMENSNEAINLLKAFMEDEKIEKVIQDGKNLVTILTKHNIEVKKFIFDTVVAAYLIDSAKSNYPLEVLINEYLMKEVKGEGDELICNAMASMKELYEYLKDRIDKEGMDELYYEVEHPLISILSSMEAIGFNVNREKLDELAVKFKEEISRTEKEIYELCEEEFNISSPKQLGKILFEKLDLPVIKKTKTGYSTNAEVLEKLMDKHPVVEKIIYYRQITKLNSTYVEGLKNVIDEDGAIHSSFNQTVTTTGRLSSTEPNLQNIPVKYEMGREIRKVFIPQESTDVLLSCDYSQIELRVLAHMSDDKNMIDAFNHHSDIHTKTASEVFKVPVEEVTPLMRSRAKAVNFGIVYGISDFSLSQDLKITRKEAAEYMEIYFDRYPKIKGYLESVKEEAKEKGYVLTVLNRRRFIPEIKSSNKIVKALGERLAMNAPIQGSAADIIKLAMVKVYNRIKKENLESQMILQVHDELILNVKENELEIVKALVKEEMENVLKMSVTLEVDTNIGNTWYDAK
ncbi:MAG: DNA polymerase I [Clostridium saudiense]|uniref:DNA polymerase I n=1 Tax=Clostridium TaxID=1485 RepID=UPI0004AF386F|nr:MULTISPECIES: DNA polymerase I [Clostridium]MBX9184025.1 DNA polymerase I [Clostridium sp. K04]MDU3522097.1 DNA polymerase I [Clostridium saudiense]MDU7453027.1 DNA polymerase I [Clostridium saudiense]CUN62713.1 DNA polymerase I [Clostridium disporicum]SCJ89481.1 DNA polymerase I [uncultured Clostridium sp.]